MPATIAKITGSRPLRATTGCSGAAATPRARSPAGRRACESRAPRTPSSSGGTCTCSPGRAARPGAGTAGSAGSRHLPHWPTPHAAAFPSTSSTRASSHVVAVRLGGLRQAAAHDEHVVVRDCGSPSRRSRTISRSCRLILFRTTAFPTAFGTAKPSRGSPRRLVALEPVERQEARRHRAALAVDGVEVARAREAVPPLHGALYADRRARPLERRRLRI